MSSKVCRIILFCAFSLIASQAQAFKFGIVGDSLSTAGNTDDICSDAFECLENMDTDPKYSFSQGDQPWSLLNRLKTIYPDLTGVLSAAKNGSRWDDAVKQVNALRADPAVEVVHIEMGGNDVCAINLPTLDELNTHITNTFTLLSETPSIRTVIVSEIPDVVQVWEVNANRPHFLFETFSDLWSLDVGNLNQDGVEDICNAVYGTFACHTFNEFVDLTESLIRAAFEDIYVEYYDGSFPCEPILSSAATNITRDNARALNQQLNALIADKVFEFDGRNGRRFFVATGPGQAQLNADRLSKLDGFHLGKAGHEWFSQVIWNSLQPQLVTPTTTTTTSSTTTTTSTTSATPTTTTTTQAPVVTSTAGISVSSSTSSTSTSTSTSTTSLTVTTTSTVPVTSTSTTTVPGIQLPVVLATQGARDGVPTREISVNGGLVYLQVSNYDEATPRNWSGSDNVLQPAAGSSLTTAVFVIDPVGLTADSVVRAQVAMVGTTAGISLKVIGSPPELGSGQDTDQDGSNDNEEGNTDADGDSIPDFLDDDGLKPNQLQADVDRPELGNLLSSLGSMQVGETAFRAGRKGARIEAADIAMPDTAVTSPCTPDCFDFNIAGLLPGTRVQVVLPLSGPIPARAVYRKLIQNIWQPYSVSESDFIGSARKVAGECPQTGDTAYTTNGTTPNGLVTGNDCIQLTMTEGGDNDADKLKNGLLIDPGGISVAAVEVPGTPEPDAGEDNEPASSGGGGGGCSSSNTNPPLYRHADFLLLALFILILTGLRRNSLKT